MSIFKLGLLLSIVTFATLVACGQETYVDVSRDPKYEGMVGARFQVTGHLLAYGIRHDSKAPIEYVTLMPPPGIAGSMIVPLGTVPPQSTLTVLAVRKTNRVFDDPLTYIVSLQGATITAAYPIHIERFRGNEGPDGLLSLNPRIYQPVHPPPVMPNPSINTDAAR